MENNKKPEEIKKETTNNDEKSKPLFEDLQGHKHDDASFNKLMNEQTNRRKNQNNNGGTEV